MIGFLGYNFCSDGNCLDPVPTSIDNITDTKLSNGIFDHWYLTADTSEPYPTTIPDQWDYSTIMDADFNGNVSAGNVDFTIAQITGFKIKRRVAGTFDWVTLIELPVATPEDLKLSFNDNLNSNFVNYALFATLIQHINFMLVSNMEKEQEFKKLECLNLWVELHPLLYLTL